MADDDSGFDRSWGIEVRFWRGSLKNGYTHRELAIRTFGGTGEAATVGSPKVLPNSQRTGGNAN